MDSKVSLWYLSALICCSIYFSACQSPISDDQLLGTWQLITGTKNNVTSPFLDGTWLVVTADGCKSNLFKDEYRLRAYAIQDSLFKVDNGDQFQIKGLTDTTLILEIVKSRNLFRLEMAKSDTQ